MISLTQRALSATAADAAELSLLDSDLTLWKDVDPDIPILKEAKAEYAKLQRADQGGGARFCCKL